MRDFSFSVLRLLSIKFGTILTTVIIAIIITPLPLAHGIRRNLGGGPAVFACITCVFPTMIRSMSAVLPNIATHWTTVIIAMFGSQLPIFAAVISRVHIGSRKPAVVDSISVLFAITIIRGRMVLRRTLSRASTTSARDDTSLLLDHCGCGKRTLQRNCDL